MILFVPPYLGITTIDLFFDGTFLSLKSVFFLSLQLKICVFCFSSCSYGDVTNMIKTMFDGLMLANHKVSVLPASKVEFSFS